MRVANGQIASGFQYYYDDLQKRFMLQLARQTIKTFLESQTIIALPPEDFLHTPATAFVTLRIQEELRGCIGMTEAKHSLGETIIRCSLSAAFQDPRFPPLRFDEIDTIDVEISLLSPFKLIEKIEEIQIGIHGVFVTLDNSRGLLLPQVAVEHGWDLENFLKHACQKAGLGSDAWRDKETRIEIFSADVFGEKDYLQS